jgi:predicted DNA-binding transcriptional regulator YafY
MRIAYVDAKGETTERVVRPVAVEYYTEATLLCAWCELRDNYRHFRADRIRSAQLLEESFAAQSGQLLAGWLALARPA